MSGTSKLERQLKEKKNEFNDLTLSLRDTECEEQTPLETCFETLHKSWSPETVNCFDGSMKNVSVAIWCKKLYFPPFLFVLDGTCKGWEIDQRFGEMFKRKVKRRKRYSKGSALSFVTARDML